MKKVFLAAVVLAGTFSMTSCKKDWNCDCTIAGQTTTSVIQDVNKSDAEDACNALSVAAAFAGGSCELK
jgi:5-enolpyruvylshikimate-3-phosphate synthase